MGEKKSVSVWSIPGVGAGEPLWKVMARLQIESLALVSRRAQAYLEIPHTLAGCSSPQDLLTSQVLFWQTAQRQYAAGFEKIVGTVPLPPTLHVPRVAVAAPLAPKPRDYMVVAEAPRPVADRAGEARKPRSANEPEEFQPTNVKLRRSA